MPTKFDICLMVNRPSLVIISVIFPSIEAVRDALGRCLSFRSVKLFFKFADPPLNLS